MTNIQPFPPIVIDDWQDLKAELQWCIENGCHGPRTERALRWAVEAIEADEARRVIAQAEAHVESND